MIKYRWPSQTADFTWNFSKMASNRKRARVSLDDDIAAEIDELINDSDSEIDNGDSDDTDDDEGK